MRNSLQYLYTFSVFFGVLITAYFMLSQDGGSRFPLRAFRAPEEMRVEASINPAISQLLQIEKELARLPKERGIIERRVPSEMSPDSQRIEK